MTLVHDMKKMICTSTEEVIRDYILDLSLIHIFLGRALKDYASRDEIVIATKISEKMSDKPNGQGLSRKAIMQEVEHCLERLQTDYIDILYIHRWDYHTPIEETMCALNDLVLSLIHI